MIERKCGNCSLCIKDDGHPYCAIKDLYTNVELDDMCDEKDIKGEYYFAEEKEGEKLLVLKSITFSSLRIFLFAGSWQKNIKSMVILSFVFWSCYFQWQFI